MNDRFWMQQALRLAAKAQGQTSPNPMVGAVIVKNGKLLGQGYHHRAGSPHAEIVALRHCKTTPRGATLYVTLEPCCHHGKTPPCTTALIQSGIRRVVVAMRDPNPKVNGRGLQALRKAKIKIELGVLKPEAVALNQPFIKSVTQSLPWVTLKAAITLDGYLAAAQGKQRQLTGKVAQRHTHQLRAQHDAILVGCNTIVRDNPRLDTRYFSHGRKLPIKVILDTHLRTPSNAVVLRRGKTIIFTSQPLHSAKAKALQSHGAELVHLTIDRHGHIPLPAMLKQLTNMGVRSLLVEGGASVHTSFIKSQLWDGLYLYLAPRMMGAGTQKLPNIPLLRQLGISSLSQALHLHQMQLQSLGMDALIIASKSRHGKPWPPQTMVEDA